jgi:hypothetical protein
LKQNYFSSHKLPKQQSTSFWSQGILGVKILVEVWACYQPLPMQKNLSKSSQNCPKSAKIYPKTISPRNCEIPPKIETLGFFYKKLAMCRGGTKAYAHHLDFQYKNFSYAVFNIKNSLCM